MRLNLERIDASGIDLTFGSNSTRRHRLTLGAATGLRGELSQTPELLRLGGVTAETLLVSLLELRFGSFTLDLHQPGSLSGLWGAYERKAETTNLRLVAHTLAAPDLEVDVGGVRARGAVQAHGVRLDLSGPTGRLQAEVLEIDDLRCQSSVALNAERLLVKNLDVSWDAAGYGAQVGEVLVPKAQAKVDGRVLAAKGADETPAPTEAKGRIVDWNVLDGVSGAVDVDVLVDLEVPVLGSRRAKHPFRVSIRSGSVNYLELENNLATLEDSLLDFSVRDDALVLERGIPLLPTRGRGKPLFVWPLGPEDLALTDEARVRLAVLPQGRPAEPEETSPNGTQEVNRPKEKSDRKDRGGKAVALRQVDFVDLQAVLRLEPTDVERTSLRALACDDLAIQGTIRHRPDSEPEDGKLTGTLRGLSGRVVDLPVGSARLDLDLLWLGQLSEVEVSFLGIVPQEFSGEFTDLRAQALSFGSRPRTQ